MTRLVPLLTVLLAAALIGGCGGGGDSMPPAAPKPTAKAEDFPAAGGKTLADLRGSTPEGPILAPSVSLLDPGTNRFGFALFDRARKQIAGAAVALYVASHDGTHARGPFVARVESLEVKPQFQSRQTAQDPDAARGVYVADVPFPKRGKYVITALARLDGRLVATNQYGVEVGSRGATPPRVGEKAFVVHTPTRADAGGDLSSIDTRVPPLAELHAADFADVVGKKPVVLVFATPQLCQSRVCGPVVDVVAQVRAGVGDRVEFIHMEIYNDNEVSKGFREQVAAYKLPTEPWTFVIDRRGRVAERFEGAVSVGELGRAVAKVR